MGDLKESAFFGCQDNSCAVEVSYPADMLKLFEGEPICQDCYDELRPSEDDPLWVHLPQFDPFKKFRQSVLKEAAKVAKSHLGSSYNMINTINFIVSDIMALGGDD